MYAISRSRGKKWWKTGITVTFKFVFGKNYTTTHNFFIFLKIVGGKLKFSGGKSANFPRKNGLE